MSATPAVALEEAQAAHRPATAEHVTVTPLGNALGAEIGGLDLARPFTPAELEAVRTAIQDHHLLCFRDQHLDSDEQVAFSQQLGPLEVFPEQDKTKARAPSTTWRTSRRRASTCRSTTTGWSTRK